MNPTLTFKIVMLICSMAAQPDRAACQPDTALDVTYGPEVKNEFLCASYGQSIMAGTAVAPSLGGDEYLKIQCRRINVGAEAERTG